ncbi:MAG TPA: hypothetical protein VFN38_18290 [Gemmatimonadaceae bacterium]|nr:hypothetical protein [Gemmatimonadaceae bacterium]
MRRASKPSPGLFRPLASIGLGVGANAAIFSLADALFLRPLDVPEPSRLVTVGTRPWRNDGLQSMADYMDFRDANRSFENVAAVRIVRAGARNSEAPAELRMGFAVSANFLRAFGVRPEAGLAGGRGLTVSLGAPSFDPVLFTLMPIALLATTLLAAAIPAKRAASIDPQRALRHD